MYASRGDYEHVIAFKNKIFEKKIGMTKIDRHFLLLYGVICFTLYTREIARNHLLYFLACKCVIYFRMTYLAGTRLFMRE